MLPYWFSTDVHESNQPSEPTNVYLIWVVVIAGLPSPSGSLLTGLHARDFYNNNKLPSPLYERWRVLAPTHSTQTRQHYCCYNITISTITFTTDAIVFVFYASETIGLCHVVHSQPHHHRSEFFFPRIRRSLPDHFIFLCLILLCCR